MLLQMHQQGTYHASEQPCRAMLLQGSLQHLPHRLAAATLDGCLGEVQGHGGCGCTGAAEAPQNQVLPSVQLGQAPPTFHYLA